MGHISAAIISIWLLLTAGGAAHARMFNTLTKISRDRFKEYGVRVDQTQVGEKLSIVVTVDRASVLFSRLPVFILEAEDHQTSVLKVPIHSVIEGDMVLRLEILRKALPSAAIRFEESRRIGDLPPVSPGRDDYEIRLNEFAPAEGKARLAPSRDSAAAPSR